MSILCNLVQFVPRLGATRTLIYSELSCLQEGTTRLDNMSPTSSSLMFWSDTPSCINWSDASALKEHETTIIEMSTLWQLHEEDIRGWHLLRKAAMKCGDRHGMKEFSICANHSAWVRKVMMARLKFRGCKHEPYPNAHIWSFSMPAQSPDE